MIFNFNALIVGKTYYACALDIDELDNLPDLPILHSQRGQYLKHNTRKKCENNYIGKQKSNFQ